MSKATIKHRTATDFGVKVSRLSEGHPDRHLGLYFASWDGGCAAHADTLELVLRRLADELARADVREAGTAPRGWDKIEG